MTNLFAVTAILLLISRMSSSCFNNPKFSYFYAGKNRNCQNIRIDESRRQEMCSRFKSVIENCPQTCGLCCVDDPDYRFRADKSCQFINSRKLQNKFCKTRSEGRMIRDACPVACDFCQGAVLKRPSTPAPVVASPPPSPTIATSAPSWICENDLTYYANNKPHLTCLRIGKDEKLRQRWCKKRATSEACPQTCGICCKDDMQWKFTTNLGTKKKCAWMKGEKNRQDRYCEETLDGRLTKLACPETCNFCFDPVQE